MAGQQHPFLSGFPNVQQSAMRTQFGGGQMVSGLMGPQQGSKLFEDFFLFIFSFVYQLCISLQLLYIICNNIMDIYPFLYLYLLLIDSTVYISNVM